MRRRPAERGVALLLVLWIFMVLGVIAFDFARFMRDDAMAGVNFAEEAQGYYVALAGMNRALFDLQQTRDTQAAVSPGGRTQEMPGLSSSDEIAPLVPPDGQWHDGDFAGSKWSVRMTDEEGRISINKAPRDLVKLVVRNLVLGPGAATQGTSTKGETGLDIVVDSIIDWRDPDDLARTNGAELEYYEKRRVPYEPKNGFFETPEELLLVRGVTSDLFYGHDGIPGLRDVITVFGRDSRVNLRTTSVPVLQALVGLTAEEAADLLLQRDEDALPLGPAVLSRNAELQRFVAEWEPKIVLMEARADITRERNQARIAAVASIDKELTEAAHIIRWFDRAPWSGVIPEPGAGDEGEPAS
jgi:general secretion pathway protein K